MDIKKFGQLICLAGILILAYGVYIFQSNQPVKFEDSFKQTPTTQEFLMNMSQGRNPYSEQLIWREAENNRAMIRDRAKKIMIAAGIVLFIGFAISASAKKPSPPNQQTSS
jgi:hypothetical protein